MVDFFITPFTVESFGSAVSVCEFSTLSFPIVVSIFRMSFNICNYLALESSLGGKLFFSLKRHSTHSFSCDSFSSISRTLISVSNSFSYVFHSFSSSFCSSFNSSSNWVISTTHSIFYIIFELFCYSNISFVNFSSSFWSCFTSLCGSFCDRHFDVILPK